MIATLLIIPGLAFVYFMLVRPVLEGMPQLKKFYAEADGFWAKVWALCGKSITILWGYILTGVGLAAQAIDPIASALGDPDLKSQVTGWLSANPKALGWFAVGVSVITIASRLRTIFKE